MTALTVLKIAVGQQLQNKRGIEGLYENKERIAPKGTNIILKTPISLRMVAEHAESAKESLLGNLRDISKEVAALIALRDTLSMKKIQELIREDIKSAAPAKLCGIENKGKKDFNMLFTILGAAVGAIVGNALWGAIRHWYFGV